MTKILHYGVKGMKWGVRKSRSSPRSDAKKLSNAELRSKIERMNLEKQYVRLKNEQKSQSAVAKGAKEVSKLVAEAGKQALKNRLAAEMTAMLDSKLPIKKDD